MTLRELISGLTDEYWTVVFKYNDKTCGIEPQADNGVITYDIWYGGDDLFKAKSIDEVLHLRAFNGKSLTEIYPRIKAEFV